MYQILIEKKDACFEKAKKTDDLDLKLFLIHAAIGYEKKAKNITLEEVLNEN